MRLLPRTLFGRLLLLLMSGLIIAQSLGIAIQLYDRGQVLHRAVGSHIAQRIGGLVELLETLPDTERPRLVSALNVPPMRMSLDIPWRDHIADANSRVPFLLTLLRRYLPPGHALRVEIEDAPTFFWRQRDDRAAQRPFRHGRPHHRHMVNSKTFLVQVKLDDGAVLTFSQQVPEEVFTWPYRLLLNLLILLLSVTALSILAVHWLTRPLAFLANAATELGRDIQRPPLVETGPLEVRQAARAFNTMQTRLIRYIRDRSRVLAAVSHDLKTPITRLRLRSELLDDATLKEKFQSDLDAMEIMVQATLDYMRGTESQEAVAPIDINALLESLQDDANETGANVTLQGTARTPFPGRPLALKRCLMNLLDNALHFGKQASIAVKDDTDRLVITIQDSGPGIPNAELEQVFAPFYRLEGSRGRHTGGTGLGLGIARNIARAHGGELTLRNRDQGGLEARVELPR